MYKIYLYLYIIYDVYVDFYFHLITNNNIISLKMIDVEDVKVNENSVFAFVQGQNISPYLTTININYIDSANDYSYYEIKMTLNDSNLMLKEVSLMVGYKSYTSFYEAYKKFGANV
mgnify:CR=1 FL=1